VQYVLSIPVFIWLATRTENFRGNIDRAIANPYLFWLLVASIVSTIAANYLIMLSISMKNATLASLIEITYPVFIVIITYIMFREGHFNPYVLAGSIMIFSGIALVYLKS